MTEASTMTEMELRRTRMGELFRAANPPPEVAEVTLVAVRTNRDPLAHPELADRWLSAAERHTPDLWRSEARRSHWFAGRVAAREAGIAAGWALEPTEMTITARPGGAPTLTSPRGVLDLSITHSGDWAMACACPRGWLLGIDYEIGADSRVHLARRVCAPTQRARHGLDPDAGTQARPGTFGAIWTLKEALLKAWRVGLVVELDALRVERLPPGLDGPATISLAAAVDPRLPWPLPEGMWSGVTRWEEAPLAAVAARGGAG
ncbi:MAG: hypothetical protein CMH57_04015 [Myxococcales bacterium]|nr:hypothetical protein [Myxococcales bacterium]